MKIGLILQAGYRLIRYKGKPVTKTSVDLEHGVINIEYRESGPPPWDNQHAGNCGASISLDMDHEALDLKFRIFLDFNEETANALLLGDVAPLLKGDIFTLEAAQEQLSSRMTSAAVQYPSKKKSSIKNLFGNAPAGLL